MAAKETTIIDDPIKKPIQETEIIISIKLPASEAVRLMGQIAGQFGNTGYVSRDSQEQSKKYCTDKKESTT